MKPLTRKEFFMAKAAGQETPDITPVTREEIFLAKAAGMDVPELEPVTRNEWFISQISGGGGGGGGSSLAVEAKMTYEMEGGGFFQGKETNAVGALIYDDANGYWTDELNISEPTAPLSLLIINEVGCVVYVYSEPSVTGSATVEQWNDEWWIHVTGDCTIRDANE